MDLTGEPTTDRLNNCQGSKRQSVTGRPEDSSSTGQDTRRESSSVGNMSSLRRDKYVSRCHVREMWPSQIQGHTSFLRRKAFSISCKRRSNVECTSSLNNWKRPTDKRGRATDYFVVEFLLNKMDSLLSCFWETSLIQERFHRVVNLQVIQSPSLPTWSTEKRVSVNQRCLPVCKKVNDDSFLEKRQTKLFFSVWHPANLSAPSFTACR